MMYARKAFHKNRTAVRGLWATVLLWLMFQDKVEFLYPGCKLRLGVLCTKVVRGLASANYNYTHENPLVNSIKSTCYIDFAYITLVHLVFILWLMMQPGFYSAIIAIEALFILVGKERQI